MTIIERFDFSSLTLDEKTLLAHELWESLHNEADSLQLNHAIKNELDRRLAAERAGEMTYVSWEDVKANWHPQSSSWARGDAAF